MSYDIWLEIDTGGDELATVWDAGPDYEVVSLEGGGGAYRRHPCGGCPWRVDQAGVFPAEAFAHSAETAYDLSERAFACHEAGSDKPTTCAGFLLRGAEHNLAVRLRIADGRIDPAAVHAAGHQLHDSYRAMAEANGLPPDHPRLRPCR